MFAALMSRTVLFATLAMASTCAFAADATSKPPAATFRASVAQPTSVRQIRLPMSKSTIIDFDDDIRDILVSNPAVADAVVRSNRRLYVIGNKYGMTNVYVYGADNRQIANLEVQVEPDVSALEQLLRRLQPQSQFHIEAVVGAVVLTGSVASPQDATQAYDVATKFLGASSSSSSSAQSASTSGPNSGSGDVQVINGLTIKGKDQVMLRVTVAEVQRTAIKSLGIDLSLATSSGTFATAVTSTNPFPVNGLTSSGMQGTVGFGPAKATLHAFEQDGLARVLSEPTLTAISGEEATFLVGGEYPIPVSQTNGVVTVDFKKYGIGLGFIPVVLSEGRISLKISTEVSEPTSTGSISLSSGSTSTTSSSFSIPGLNVRRASSTVELSSGSTMVMAGLLSDDVKQAMSGTPGIMNIPILGSLFRSRDFQRTQTELAVFVQPIIVQGVPAGKLVRPDQNFAVASDAATVFLGQLNRMYRATDRAPTGTYQGRYGFIYE